MLELRRRTPLELAPAHARPRVLVLMASFNGAAWVDRQLDSILGQSDVDISVVVRDDCSTDHTVSVVRTLASRGRVRIVSATRPTGSASQNFFSLVRDNPGHDFDFVAFADQDDFWYPDKVARACEQLKRSGAVGYSSAVTATWDDGKKRILKQSTRSTRFDFLFEGAGQGCTFVLRAEFYERARRFLTNHAQLTSSVVFHDWALYSIARAWDLLWTFDATPSMEYRQHDSNSIGARSSLAGIRKRLSLIRNHWYKEQLMSIARLSMAAAPHAVELQSWLQSLASADSLSRRLKVAQFCFTKSRRSAAHRAVLGASALVGWI